MRRNILYLCLLALLAISCEKKESFLYEETDGLYFALPGAAEKPWTSEEPDKFNQKVDFTPNSPRLAGRLITIMAVSCICPAFIR